jgi:hypothetical protein
MTSTPRRANAAFTALFWSVMALFTFIGTTDHPVFWFCVAVTIFEMMGLAPKTTGAKGGGRGTKP